MRESFLITEGLDKAARRPNRVRSNSLQIVPLTESTEHLLEREGPDEVAADRDNRNALEKNEIGVATGARLNLGDRLWGALARPSGPSLTT
jgi:hypothetical protein